MIRSLTRRQVIERLTGDQGQPLTILPWWDEVLADLDNASVYEILIKMIRQTGKSQCCLGVAQAETFTVPSACVVYVSASGEQGAAIYARKVRRPVERLARALGIRIQATQRGYEIPALGSTFEVIAPNETTAPGRSPTLLLLDEARDIPDSVYETLVPSVIGAGGKVIIASTPGRPRGFFYELVRSPGPGSRLIESNENLNPYASKGVLAFLRSRLRMINPAAAARELGGEFAEEGGQWLPGPLIEANVDPDWHEVERSAAEAYAALDLSRKKDLTTLIVLLRQPARRPEAQDHLDVALLAVFDPAQSPTGEVDFPSVRALLAVVAERRFPNLRRLLVDEGAEGGSVLPWARGQVSLTMKVEGFVATVDSNMAIWSALAARLHAQTVSIPRNERLLAELRNLRQEPTLFGSKWRITDASRRYHRDVAAALAMAVHAAGEMSVGVLPTQVRMWAEARAAAASQPVATPAEPIPAMMAAARLRHEQEEAAELAKQRDLEERDRRRLLRDGRHWTNWS